MPLNTFIIWMNSWGCRRMNTISLPGICRCSVRVSQAKRGKRWANDKMAGENVKRSKHFSFPVDEVVQTIMEGGSELDGTTTSPSRPRPRRVPAARRMSLFLSYWGLDLGLGGPALFPGVCPLAIPSVSSWWFFHTVLSPGLNTGSSSWGESFL